MTFIDRIVIVAALVLVFCAAGNFPATATQVPATMPPASDYTPKYITMKHEKPAITSISTKQQLKCLADNIYYEASNQPYEGQLGVAFVTLNRLAAQEYPNSICGVVYQRLVPTYCQFSWVCEEPTRFNRRMWQEAMRVAQIVVEHYTLGLHNIQDPTHGALFFHTTQVAPKWKTAFIQTVQIADHIFYRK